MKSVSLVITQDHIDRGEPARGFLCVGALALSDLFGRKVHFFNSGFTVDGFTVDAPPELMLLGDAFDSGRDSEDYSAASYDAIVHPQTIVLGLPDYVAALIPEPRS